ncbi:MAG: LysE family translocator, partial [Actinomycetota bacterium]
VPALHDIVTFAVASLALLVIPGPAVIYILNRSVADGREAGLAAVAGLELGNLMHVLAASVGLSAVLATSATAFNVVKWLGAGYLIFVGIRTLLVRPAAIEGLGGSMSRRRSFLQGIVVNTLNPKVALFFVSYLPQFIDSDQGAAWSQALVLGVIFVAIGCITDASYALMASALRTVLVNGRSLPFVQRYVAGSVFIGLGLLATRASSRGH